jgi:thiazole synthase ThiGH ThiG subunit
LQLLPNLFAWQRAFKEAIKAGREAREIGLAEKLGAAAATSPVTGFLS